ncbi:HD domain-containing protein [Sulfurovum sp. zt1-1]|uniref:HD domain-containing protein n=1 Tax=Sulfurovum zhangzhouensis TaxID=3019067 RepID=A0ABT7QXY9_9BACT|nr:HD domain-containing phosphohydrolase [Sulfurovum zhangzhouensis]MDM5271657.1 HD domain-containing protein [Sulfurovum zhangzhouensis]
MANLHQLIYALSTALDFVGIDDKHHGKRVAYMALETAKELKYSDNDLIDLFHLALIHDCGVPSSRIDDTSVLTFDWEGAEEHCIRGYQILNVIPNLKHLSDIVLYHHTHYDMLTQFNINTRTAKLANLIFLTDSIDTLIVQEMQEKEQSIITIANQIRSEVKNLSQTFFDPELVDAFLKVSTRESFWFTLDKESLQIYFENYLHQIGEMDISIDAIAEIVQLFAIFVDSRSPYTADHLYDVAELSKYIAQKAGLDPETCNKIRIAGLLHDLGKLKVPDELIDRETSLSNNDLNIIKRHPYETHQLLSKINGMEDIANWAAQHHENLRGTGYPYHLVNEDISLPIMIISVADIFQALAQNRPYRNGMKANQILKILNKKVRLGELDRSIVRIVEENLQICWKLSIVNSSH